MNARKREYFFVLIFIGILIYFFPRLSTLGFWVSEYLSKAPKLNYIISIGMIVVGFIDCYRRLRFTKLYSFRQAISSYLSLGLAMSGIYQLVQLTHKNCFLFPQDIADNPTIIDFTYFSFVTVTTVGYGDIVPLHTFVRALVLIQVISGLILILYATKTNLSDKPDKKVK